MADLTTRQLDPDVFAIVVGGEWDRADDLDVLRAWGDVLNSGAAGVVVDLGACTFMDASALRTLFQINREAEQREIRWAVVSGSCKTVRRLFDLTDAQQALPIVHQWEAAIKLASPGPTNRTVPTRGTVDAQALGV